MPRRPELTCTVCGSRLRPAPTPGYLVCPYGHGKLELAERRNDLPLFGEGINTDPVDDLPLFATEPDPDPAPGLFDQ